MAQQLVSDFYSVCKKNPEIQAKRLKNVKEVDDISAAKLALSSQERFMGKTVSKVSKKGNGRKPRPKKDASLADIRASFQLFEQKKLNATKIDSEKQVPVCTPTRKLIFDEEEASNVRVRREKLPKDLEVTPTTETVLTPKCHSSVAKRRLNLDFEESVSNKRPKYDQSVESDAKAKVSSKATNKEIISSDAIKMKLKSCGKLKELQECLSKVKDCATQIRNLQAKHPRSPVKSLIENPPSTSEPSKNDFSLPKTYSPKSSSPQKSANVTPKKSPPAYQQYYHLTLSPTSASLPLPYHFKVIAESFRCLDTVVSLLHNRKENCFFTKLKNSVQDMMRRSFDLSRLAQIKTVFPRAYNYSYEKMPGPPKPKESQFQLTLSPNFNYDETRTATKSGFQIMNPSCLLERRNIFSKHLLNIVKEHHEKFLLEMNPSLQIPSHKVNRWHPNFKLHDLPDVSLAILPNPPDTMQHSTAQDVLDKIRGTVNEKIEKALESVSQAHESKKDVLKPPSLKVGVGVLKGISSALLEKIRAKEAAKVAKVLTCQPEVQRRNEMISSLPEMIRILRGYFITEKRAAISLDDALQKLGDSYHSALSMGDLEAHIHLIAELLPHWLSLIQIRKGLFLKIDKSIDVSLLCEELKKAISDS